MNKRPLAVTIIGWVYIVTGAGGFIAHLLDFIPPHQFQYDSVLVEIVCLIGAVSGIYLLCAQNWARWLAVAWMAYHVVLSIFHTIPQLALHAVFCVLVAYLLFRRDANSYFRASMSYL